MIALTAGAPLLLMAVLAAVLGAALVGVEPLWRESEPPNLAYAAYEEDRALLERVLTSGGDPDARHDVLIDGRHVTVTPLEAAIAAHSVPVIQLLITHGARVNAATLHCLADDVGADDVLAYLKTLQQAPEDHPCGGFESPLRR